MKRFFSALPFVLCAMLGPAASAHAAPFVFQTINGDATPGNPGCCYWANPSGKIGWYWTPSSDVDLLGIQTQLHSGENNINNNFTMTVGVYTERPATGGTLLDALSFNASTSVDGPWVGGTFASPLVLHGGTTYFLGFSGWDQVLTGSGGGGINYVTQVGANTEFLPPAAFYGTTWQSEIDPSAGAGFDAPILRFIADQEAPPPPPTVPEPATITLLGSGLAAVLLRRRQAR